MTKICSLKKYGFKNIGMIQQLLKQGLPSIPELNSCGVYAISIPNKYTVKYLLPEMVSEKKNVVNPWSKEDLEDKWVDNAEIICYAFTNRILMKRLKELLKHGLGKTTDKGPHRGEEIMWQLQDYEQFSIWILPTWNASEPRDRKNYFLKEFRKVTGKFPFANRRLS